MKKDIGCNGLRGSEITLYGESPQIEKADKMQSRTKVKTNGHFTTYMQVCSQYIRYKHQTIPDLILWPVAALFTHHTRYNLSVIRTESVWTPLTSLIVTILFRFSHRINYECFLESYTFFLIYWWTFIQNIIASNFSIIFMFPQFLASKKVKKCKW